MRENGVLLQFSLNIIFFACGCYQQHVLSSEQVISEFTVPGSQSHNTEQNTLIFFFFYPFLHVRDQQSGIFKALLKKIMKSFF